jgi:hypothetical protein
MALKVDTKHREYDKYERSWLKCRTVAEGSEAIKAAGEAYLPSLVDQAPEEYTAYKKRALFFEGTTRTISGLIGLMFAKEPTLNKPDGSEFFLSITPSFTPIKTFLKNLAEEVVTVGRAGILVDVDESGKPYIVQYKAEDILNWRVAYNKEGKSVVSFVVLREESEEYEDFTTTVKERYRVLSIDEEGKYKQELYLKQDKNSESFVLHPNYPLFPKNKGRELQAIPFYFINVNGTQPSPGRPPLLGLVNTNISHYLNSADLEHGRHLTGLPTPWVAGFAVASEGKLSIGSQSAWVSNNPAARAGFLEFTGQGLMSLENALKEKQDQMIVLGARLLEAPKKASESADNQRNRKQGESSILANIADSVSEGVTKAAQFAADWAGEQMDKYSVEIHKDFITLDADPKMINAMISALQASLISWDTWFYNLKAAGMIPDGVDAEEEKTKIKAQNTDFGLDFEYGINSDRGTQEEE